jgi:uncharacterized protein (TIGR00255 family)
MIKSMTGYGKVVAEAGARRLTVEVRSLNSKQLDLSLRIPALLRDKDAEIRNLAAQKLERGKADISVLSDTRTDSASVSINRELVMQYHAELKSLQAELNESCPDGLLPVLMRMPDVIQTSKEELAESEWLAIRNGIENALALADEFRINEGATLSADIEKRINLILQYLDEVEPFESQRLTDIREKMLRDFAGLKGDFNGSAPDQNRFEQEMIYYLERLDITEEKVRLRKHCEFFLETMHEETSQGKKLGFISQEIGREINTLGSKAGHAGIQKLVVGMKDELEKIKEQLMNIL